MRRLECLLAKEESLAEAALEIDNDDDCDDSGHDDNRHYHDENDDIPETFTDGNPRAAHLSVEGLCHKDRISVIKP